MSTPTESERGDDDDSSVSNYSGGSSSRRTVDVGPGESPETAESQRDEEDWQLLLGKLCLENSIVALPKLHIRKHVVESVLRYRPHLLCVFVPLWMHVVPYAKKKWEEVRGKLMRLRKEALARRSASESEEAAAAAAAEEEVIFGLLGLQGAFAGSLAPLVSPPSAPELQNQPAAMELGEAQRADEAGDSEARRAAIEADIEIDDGALTGSAMAFGGAPDDDDDHTYDLTSDPSDDGIDVDAPRQFANKTALNKAGMTIREMQAELVKRGVQFDEESKNKGALLDLLWQAIKPRADDTLTGNDNTVSVSLHRGKQQFYHLLLMWCGRSLGWPSGRAVREKVVALARDTLARAKRKISDDEAIGTYCAKSSYFDGMWRFFDFELRLAVKPFEDYVDGKPQDLVQQLHLLLLQVSAADKPQVRKVMLILLERILHYRDNHKDVLEFICANASAMDEEDIEFLNALLGRFVQARQALTMSVYRYTSGILGAVNTLQQRLDEIALRGRTLGSTRRTENTEHEALRRIYTTKAWETTNDKIEEWIIGRFKAIICGSDSDIKVLDACFPRHDRIQEALKNMGFYINEFEAWKQSCRRVVYTDSEGGAAASHSEPG